MSEALLIAAHGSRDEAGVEEFWDFADAWRQLRPDRIQAAGFLEFAQPTIGDAIDELIDRGATRIVVAPAMLMAAGHVKNDVPSEVQESRVRHPNVTFQMARALDIHPALLELCHVRYRETIAGLSAVPAERTLLLLVGRGTSDPDANANIARVSRFLWESYGVGWASVAFSGVTTPDVDQALTVCRRLGYDRIVVQPYFLFDGILLKRIRDTAAHHAALDSGVEIVTVPHLRLHPLLLQAFEDRAHEAIHGAPHMNCDLCKYRVRLIGRETELGLPQVGHHHHVRATPDLADDFDHGHDHRLRRRRRSALVPAAADTTFHPWDERLLQRLHLIAESR
ncbi:sirohydrochlorin cobaltochelatase [Singulisphaera sp. GP187]|uniref:sirohydrochlorin chelatase n=1 Tax=Singulisphaera sp. GP187 TaxID=1882752 RepID=UPI0009270A6D|nr:sirohydrochlorin chelatase [Singulisphaera sp. GP187]SIO63105.1 sirohydrochlorin cobaltochelatase [Singulisphaera sp. GP187]